MRQESTGLPSSKTAQAPHSPSSQPCFVPVWPRSSRRTSSKVLYGANETSVSSPFSVNRICAVFCDSMGSVVTFNHLAKVSPDRCALFFVLRNRPADSAMPFPLKGKPLQIIWFGQQTSDQIIRKSLRDLRRR